MKLSVNISCFLLAVALLTYTVLRAINLSFTHDESLTYLYSSHFSVLEIISNRTDNLSANNHILNTLLMKLFESLFGSSELVLRLQSIMAHIMYLIITWLLLKPLQSPLLILAGFILLNVNPYLLEFFSLARGYALAIAFMLWSIYFFIRFMEEEKNKHICISIITACLAAISNFGLLYFLIILFGFYQFCLYTKHKNIKLVFSKSKSVYFILFVMIAFCYEPMRKLIISHQLTFGGQDGFWADTVSSTIFAYLNTIYYDNEDLIVLLIRAFIIVTMVGYSTVLLFKYQKKRLTNQGKIGFLFTGILWSIVVLNITLHTVLNSPFINDRFALFIVPLFFFVLIFLLNELLYQKRIFKITSIFLALSLASAMAYHFSRAYNLEHCMNWHYDACTKTMINDLISERERTKKETIRLSNTWLFAPSINFYRVTKGLTWLNEVTKEGPKEGFDYYYVTKDDFSKIDSLNKSLVKVYTISESKLMK